ncbi:hypothetical protein [uncultured Jatrophihabitans sp.]|uniref:phosphatase domain-containing protein n=1 Tax=uncultured Jatrophihabitans sp. TaxID=1610747 RepID=UPI0035CBA1C4
MLAVFDIDGVVADVRHRLHHLEHWHAWDEFFDAAQDDPLLDEGLRLVTDLKREHDVVWLTGRPEWLRGVTERWLRAHDLPAHEVHMRPSGDYRPARFYRLDVLRELRPRGVAALIDDDDEVVQAARHAGFPAVLADWVPCNRVLRRAQERDGRT